MTKISALSDIGTSVASNDTFVLVDVSDPTTPNKKIQQQNLFLLPDGSQGTPALRFLNDTDVGLYRPTTNALGFVTGGSERLRINSSGRVGIGTSSPGSYDSNADDLVVANTSGNAGISIVGSTTGVSSLYFGDGTGSSTFRGYIDYLHSSDTLRFGTGASTRAVIDSSGRVGIGTTSPDDTLHLVGSTGYGLKNTDGTHTVVLRTVSGGGILKTASNHALVFGTNDTERARIDSSGRLLVGTSSQISPSFGFKLSAAFDNNASGGIALKSTASGSSTMLEFINNSGSVQGKITANGSTTSYQTTSDYRLKENVVDLDGAIDRLKQLPVHRFNFIADPDTVVDGFIAHEAAEVVPECVTGIKDEVDDDGNPIYQGIDQSKLVPLLTAALQEAIGRIETLEAEVAALKG